MTAIFKGDNTGAFNNNFITSGFLLYPAALIKAVLPDEVLALTSAPAFNKNFIISGCLLQAASIRTLVPNLFLSLTSAPASTKTFTTSK